jgi:hypothetical protein
MLDGGASYCKLLSLTVSAVTFRLPSRVSFHAGDKTKAPARSLDVFVTRLALHRRSTAVAPPSETTPARKSAPEVLQNI